MSQELTSLEVEQPLQGRKLQEKEDEKDEKRKIKLIRKNPSIKDA